MASPAIALRPLVAAPDALHAAVRAALARALPAGGRAAIALSGGRDSMALLDAAARVAPAGIALVALHVHHGLSVHADAWAGHCAQQALARGLAFSMQRVDVQRHARESLEDVARRARRAALAALAREARATVVLLAHHQDDQAETLLLQLMRGAGPRGLAGMASHEHADGVAWLRPLLAMPRADIDAYVARERVAFVEDDSNARTEHRRNALRREVVPALRAIAPGYPATLARAASHQAEAADLLRELAMLDAAPFRAGTALHRAALTALSPPRARNVLRTFLHEHGLPPPSTVRLRAMLAQLSTARADARVRIRHGGRDIGIHLDHIVVHRAPPSPFTAAWRGESALQLPHGTLACVSADRDGLDAERLFRAGVTVRSRVGGEQLRTHEGGPLRALKDILREAGVPPWERPALPLVYADATLAAVPGIAADPAWRVARGGRSGVTLVWSPRHA